MSAKTDQRMIMTKAGPILRVRLDRLAFSSDPTLEEKIQSGEYGDMHAALWLCPEGTTVEEAASVPRKQLRPFHAPISTLSLVQTEPQEPDFADTIAGLIVHGIILTFWLSMVWIDVWVSRFLPVSLRYFNTTLMASMSIGLIVSLFKIDEKLIWPRKDWWFTWWRIPILLLGGTLLGVLFFLSTYLVP